MSDPNDAALAALMAVERQRAILEDGDPDPSLVFANTRATQRLTEAIERLRTPRKLARPACPVADGLLAVLQDRTTTFTVG